MGQDEHQKQLKKSAFFLLCSPFFPFGVWAELIVLFCMHVHRSVRHGNLWAHLKHYLVSYTYCRLIELNEKPEKDISSKRTWSAGGELPTSCSTLTYCFKISGHLIRQGDEKFTAVTCDIVRVRNIVGEIIRWASACIQFCSVEIYRQK